MGYDEDDLGEQPAAFLAWMERLREYLIEQMGWSSAEADEYASEPQMFHQSWVRGYSPAHVVTEDLCS